MSFSSRSVDGATTIGSLDYCCKVFCFSSTKRYSTRRSSPSRSSQNSSPKFRRRPTNSVRIQAPNDENSSLPTFLSSTLNFSTISVHAVSHNIMNLLCCIHFTTCRHFQPEHWITIFTLDNPSHFQPSTSMFFSSWVDVSSLRATPSPRRSSNTQKEFSTKLKKLV